MSRVGGLRRRAHRGSSRAQWWTTFLLATVLGGMWLLATPLFAAPDEQAHAIRAASVARGQVLGDEVDGEERLVVQAPFVYQRAGEALFCFAFQPNQPADCASFSGSSRLVDVPTSAGRHPPFYYAVAGLPTVAFPSAFGVYLMRLISVLVTAAFVASTVVTVQRTRAPRITALGILLALTPMVWFVSGIVNPSALEIAAAVALWVGGTVLVQEAPERVDPRLVTRVGIAASALVLSRQLAPLWLALIAGALLALGGKASILPVIRTRLAQIWMAIVAACAIAQAMWVVIVKPLDTSLAAGQGIPNLSTGTAIRQSFGETFERFQHLIGWFGWLDTPSPSITIFVWIATLGALASLAALLASKRYLIVGAAVAVVTILVPIVAEARNAQSEGFFWQGRYTLPFAIGVPIVLALGAARSERAIQIPPRALWMGTIALAVGQFAAFAQALRRNTVGYDGDLLFAFRPYWVPPIPGWLLLFVFATAIAGFTAWLMTLGGGAVERPEGRRRVSRSRASATRI